ncbi:MAG TPA: arginase family protein [Gaiellaceae bacterium]|jgi:arginase|nr:arginase family protein [Gaiellaceae bacterium]
MDLHVVEIPIAYLYGRRTLPRVNVAPEWELFREAGVYEPIDGELTFAQAKIDLDETVEDDPVADVSLLGGRIAEAVAEGVRAGKKVMMVGGNCTCVPGMVGGLKQGLGQMTKIGLVWIDAHGDFNTPSTQADGLLGAMPVSTVAGFCLPAWRKGAGIEVPLTTDQIVMVDVRHLGDKETTIVEASDITVVGIDSPELGPAVDRLAAETDLLYVHIDLDILDRELIPAHMAQEPGGPTVEDTVAALDRIFATGRVDAFALVSLYAFLPEGDKSVDAALGILKPAVERWASVTDAAVAAA